jgi:hypothetical protein
MKNAIFWDNVAFVRIYVSGDYITSITRMIRIGKLGTMLAVASNQMMV